MGKTHLSVFLSKRLQRLCEVQKDSIALFFFCDNKVETRNTGSSILRGLIYQLIQYRKDLVRIPLQQWKMQEDVFSGGKSFQSLWGMFEDMTECLPNTEVYCLIDALDECEKESALLVLKKFNKLIEAKSRIKFIAVSRRHPEHIAESLFSAISIEIDSDIAAKDDVKRYITDRVGHLAQIKGITNKPLHRQIENVFLGRAQDTFLWVSFMTHDLLPKTVVQIEAALDQLPTGLDAVYDRILRQVDPEKAETISKLLGWVALAARPLAVSEICEALYIQPTPFVGRDQVCLDYIRACGHLLQVTQVEDCAFWDFDCQCDDRPFEEGGKQYQQRVTLVHQSVKDYLLNNQADTRMKFHVRDPRRMHEEIATRLMEEIRNGCVEDAEKYWRWSLSRRLAWPFGIYSIRNWDYHFLQVSDYRAFAQLHGDFFRDRSALRAKWYVCRRYYRKHRTSLLAVACEFDWEGPARRLLQLRTEQFGSREVEVYVNEYFEDEDSAVMNVACHFGHLNMVTLLLEYGANPNWPALTEYCWRFDDPTTFAQMVARGGGKELLEAKGGDLLIEAARHGRANICDLLIETYGVPVDAKNRVGKTALSSALVFGHMELAHILVNEWRASTDDHWQLLKSIKSRFPYHSDATGTHFQNLLHFIKRWGININASDPSTGRGLVHYDEIRYLKKEDVESLLRLGLDLSAQDHWGNTIIAYNA
ncbi:hypothetical protein V2G26_004167 [Clonostachys chloroleuca]